MVTLVPPALAQYSESAGELARFTVTGPLSYTAARKTVKK